MSKVSFEGQVVVVTGAGRGLGRGYCLELADRDAQLVVNDVDAAAADAVVAEITERGGTALASYESVSSPETAAAIIAQTIERYGTVDAVVNNAGFMRNAVFEDQTSATLDALLDVHVRGSFFVTQAAWPVMRAKGYGRVVMTTSAAGLFALQNVSNYATAKGGIFGLTKALAYEGRKLGILVNVVLPHALTTIRGSAPIPGVESTFKPGVLETLAPLRRVEVLAPFVAYLCHPAATMTGEAYSIGMGRFARVFVGVTPGWIAEDADAVEIEDLIEHIDEIRDEDGYLVPQDCFEEMEHTAIYLGWSPPVDAPPPS